MPIQSIIDDDTLIPQLAQNILGEEMFFRVADDMAMLGFYDEKQASYHLPYLSADDELTYGLLRILTELQTKWMSPIVGRAIRWLYSPDAMLLLRELADQRAAQLTSENVRLCQSFVSQTLERLLNESKEGRFERINITDRYSLQYYLNSDEAINDVFQLDMLTVGLHSSMSDKEFSSFVLHWCTEKMGQVWHDRAVSASLGWITRNHGQIVSAIVASESFSGGSSCHPPEQARIICEFCATVIERFATDRASMQG